MWGDGSLNVDIIWSNLLDNIKDKLTSLSYNTWFDETELYKLNSDKAYIIVPMPIHKKHLLDNYYDLISSNLYALTNNNYDLVFLLREEIEDEKDEVDDILSDLKDNNRVSINSKINSNLNRNYTFDNFIVGNSNKFAHAAALSVAENPGRIYNPLFLYGNSGVGKTHLMHAIGNFIQDNSDKRVLYVTSEQFVDEFVKTNRKDDSGTNFNYVEFFKDKYRNIDVLIIDDIQYLGGAQQSQQEFFHTSPSIQSYLKIVIAST